MITYVNFSLFESPAKVLVNTVNTVGVMGKGIAKDFKAVYPEMFEEYQKLCERRMFDVGNLWLYKTSNKWVLNFPTKRHWRNPSKPEFIRDGLAKFAAMYQDAYITSISFPMLGCGNGELDWESQVKPLMEEYLSDLPIEILIHKYPFKSVFLPEHRDVTSMKQWLRRDPGSLGFEEVWGDIVELIGEGRSFTTSTRRDTYRVALLDDGQTIGIETRDGLARIDRDQFLDLWQQIRDLGLCVPGRMPGGIDRYSDYVLPILAELQYLSPIQQSLNDDNFSGASQGLLLNPLSGNRPPTQYHTLTQPRQLALLTQDANPNQD